MKRYTYNRGGRKPEKYARKVSNTSDSSSSDNSSTTSDLHLRGGDDISTYEVFRQDVSRHFTSSPVNFANEVSNDDSFVSAEDLSESKCSSEESESVSDLLYPGAPISKTVFSDQLLRIKSKHALSDSAVKSILNLMTASLPVPNKCPTFSELNNMTPVDKYRMIKCPDSSVYYLLDLEHQLRRIMTNNPEILNVQFDSYSDMKNSTHFKSMYVPDASFIYVVLNVDGLASVFESRNYKTWTVLASIVNLSPTFRKMFSNILFCCLYYGEVKPNFDFFMNTVVDHLNSVFRDWKISY